MKKSRAKWKRRSLLALSAALLLALGLGETERALTVPAAACLSLCGGETPKMLVPVGRAVGIKLFSEGVMVVGLAESAAGGPSPAQLAGLEEGDRILAINGEEVESTEHVQSLLRQSDGSVMTLSVFREDRELELSLAPESGDGGARMGAWIRDSMAGIGTVTYVDPATGRFAALGHSINDVDTGLLMPLADGAVMAASITMVRRGSAGEPGELKGSFDLTADLGILYDNNECGVFGVLEKNELTTGEALPVASPLQVRPGKATILADVSGSGTEEYEIEISRLYPLSGSTRNMLITVTDQRLLSLTGGIVQGMSGSPIIQDGKLVGAVTHVLLKDPTRGYGIFIENMLDAAG